MMAAELAGLGAEATVAACDVADREELAAVLASVPEQYPLAGVVHAAGVGDTAVLDTVTVTGLGEVMSAKVAGAVNLDALTGGRPLELFIMFSSIAGVWGSGGQGAYSAANAVLDALAEQRRSRQQYGSTDAPLAPAMSTAVEKTSTSTTIRTSLIGASVCTPARPHSQRRSYSAWSQITAVYAESLSQSAGSPKRKPCRLGSMERSRPVSTPPAPTSTKRCTPCAARYRMDSAQRTGLGTCSYRPCRASAPVRTSCACQLFTSGQLKPEKAAAFKSADRRS